MSYAMKLAQHKLTDNVIEVQIFNKFVQSLIDTGSCRSVASEQLVKTLGVKITKNQTNSKFLTTADGSPLQVLGVASLTVRIYDLAIPFEFLVVAKLNQELIL